MEDNQHIYRSAVTHRVYTSSELLKGRLFSKEVVFKVRVHRDFPGGPVAKTPSS